MPMLKSVSTELPDPPYPDDTKAGAFPFDLEVDRMIASDTWVVVNPDARPWCLLSWVLSWSLIPCGSFPNDDAVIASRLGCSRAFFDGHRKDIMRGWVLHSDNRFYHPVVTEKVLQFLSTRDKWKGKKRGQREQKMSHGTPRGLSGESKGSPHGVPMVSPPSSSSSSSSSSSYPLSTHSGKLEVPSSFMSRGNEKPSGKVRKNSKPQTAASVIDRATSLPSWEDVSTVIERVNVRSGRKHRLKNHAGKFTADAELIRKRLSEWTLEEALSVVDGRADLWIGDEKMEPYFRIGTIFARRNFEQYRSSTSSSAYVYGSFLNSGADAVIEGESTRV